MATLNLKVKGLPQVLKALEKFGKDGDKVVQNDLKSNVQDIVLDAKSIAQAKGVWFYGDLVRGIVGEKINKFQWVVVAKEKYSAYMEFGTGKGFKNAPPELLDLAAQFKGRGVREVNIEARPFLYPAVKGGLKTLLKDLKESYEFLIKKFNR